VLFFCSEETAKLAGEGRAAWERHKANGGRLPRPTPFDSPQVAGALSAANIKLLAKVTTTPANAALARRFDAPPNKNTLVLCGPNDEVIVKLTPNCCSAHNLLLVLKNFQARYEGWLKHRGKRKG